MKIFYQIIFFGILLLSKPLLSFFDHLTDEQKALFNKEVAVMEQKIQQALRVQDHEYAHTLLPGIKKIDQIMAENNYLSIDQMNMIIPGFQTYVYYLYKEKYPASTTEDFFYFSLMYRINKDTLLNPLILDLDTYKIVSDQPGVTVQQSIKAWWSKWFGNRKR